MLVKKIIKIIFILILLISGRQILSYDNSIIHPSLTRAAAEIYNTQTNQKLTQDKVNLMVQGAIAEDTDPRYLNHFYDPSTGQGFNDGALKGKSAKDWANNQSSISGDYSINTILANYKKGDTKRAYQGIGHILHLIQDMSVPAHTRNDSHPDGDPYEAWAKQYAKPNLNKVKFIKVNSINNAFDELASYSHNNFYSKDTIDSSIKFDNIKIEKDLEGLDFSYAYRSNYKFLKIKKYKWGDKYLFDFKVHIDYWNLLSPKAIGYSAGVIDWFIKEFEKIDQGEKEIKKELSFLDKARGVFSNSKENLKYKFGDTFIAARVKTERTWSSLESSLGKTGQEIGFFSDAYTETVIDASKAGVKSVKNIGLDAKLFFDQSLENIMTIMPIMSVIPEIAQASTLVLVNYEDDNQEKKPELIKPKISNKQIIKKQGNNSVKLFNKNKEIKKDIVEINIPKIESRDVALQRLDKVEIIEIAPDSELEQIEDRDNIPEIVVLDKENADQLSNFNFEGFSPGFIVSSGRSVVAIETFIIVSPSAISSSTSASFVFASDKGDVSFSYNFDDNGWISSENDELNIINLQDGEHVLQVKAQDKAGNSDPTPVQYSWTIDATPPIISIVNAPSNFASSTSASFLLQAQESVFWQCQIDSTIYRNCSASTTIDSLENGSHVLAVNAQDNAGNISSTTYNWMIDLESPIVVMGDLNTFYPSAEFSLNLNGHDCSDVSPCISTSTSGIHSFDVQYKLNDGDWQNLAVMTASTTIEFDKIIDLGSDVSFQARVRDNAGNISEWSSKQVTRIGTDHLVISEIKIGGSKASDEFIEIYNPTNEKIDLSNYSIQYRGSSATSFKKKNFEANSEITSKGYFLIASSQYTGSVEVDMSHSTFSLSGNGGTIFLVDNQDLLTDQTVTSTSIDRVAYGSGNYLFPEGSAHANTPSNMQSLERKALASSSSESMNDDDNLLGNAYDFDDNSSDFIIQSNLSPQNSRAPIEPRDSDALVPGIISLSSQNIGMSSIGLIWNSQVNANISDSAYYDARYILKDEDCDLQINWSSATKIDNMPTPSNLAGQSQSVNVENLSDGEEYCFAVKVFNGEFWSNLSVQLSVTTVKDVAIKTDQSRTGSDTEIWYGSNQNNGTIRYVYQSFTPQSDNISGVVLRVCRRYFNDIKGFVVKICQGDNFSGSSGCNEVTSYIISGTDQDAIALCDEGFENLTLLFDQDYSINAGDPYHILLSSSSFNMPYSPAFITLASSNDGYSGGYMETKKKVWDELVGYDLWFKTLYR